MLPHHLALARLNAALQRFRDDMRGSLSVEAVLILPVLMWAYLASLVWFDAFRTDNTNVKAAYAISDALSRQTAVVTPEDLDGLRDLFAFLSNARNAAEVRISSLWLDPDTMEPGIIWSYGTGPLPAMTLTDLQQMADVVPVIPPGDTVIFVETVLAYEPPINVGLRPRVFTNQIPARPRFVPQVLFSEQLVVHDLSNDLWNLHQEDFLDTAG